MIPLVFAMLLWKHHCWHEQWMLGSFKCRAVKKGCRSQYFAFWQYKMLYNCFNTANSNSPNPVAFMLNKITRIGACREWDLDNDISFLYIKNFRSWCCYFCWWNDYRVAVPVKLLVIKVNTATIWAYIPNLCGFKLNLHMCYFFLHLKKHRIITARQRPFWW